jgi:TPR repeat protein
MIKAMHRRSFLLSSALVASALAALALGRSPAWAQFYDLEGKYHCLTSDDPACAASGTVLPPPPDLGPSPPPPPTIAQVIADIRAQKLSTADLQVLEKEAAKKEPHAVEALAWCRLNGLGVPADPVAAYFLYGEAAGLGMPNAKANQRAIFERRLTQEQRQAVLMREQTR